MCRYSAQSVLGAGPPRLRALLVGFGFPQEERRAEGERTRHRRSPGPSSTPDGVSRCISRRSPPQSASRPPPSPCPSIPPFISRLDIRYPNPILARTPSMYTAWLRDGGPPHHRTRPPSRETGGVPRRGPQSGPPLGGGSPASQYRPHRRRTGPCFKGRWGPPSDRRICFALSSLTCRPEASRLTCRDGPMQDAVVRRSGGAR